MTTNTPPHVIFGTGAVGRAVLDALQRRGETVRMVNTSGVASVPAEVEVVGGDAADPAFATNVSRGARVIYQTLNPPYSQWSSGVRSSPPCRPACSRRRRRPVPGW